MSDLEKSANLLTNLTDSQDKSFDDLLANEWNEAMENGLFKFKIDGNRLQSRYLPGKYNFLVQYNPKRFTEKRQTEFKIRDLNEPFNPSIFNFTKIKSDEVLVKLVKDKEEFELVSAFKSRNFNFISSLKRIKITKTVIVI